MRFTNINAFSVTTIKYAKWPLSHLVQVCRRVSEVILLISLRWTFSPISRFQADPTLEERGMSVSAPDLPVGRQEEAPATQASPPFLARVHVVCLPPRDRTKDSWCHLFSRIGTSLNAESQITFSLDALPHSLFWLLKIILLWHPLSFLPSVFQDQDVL